MVFLLTFCCVKIPFLGWCQVSKALRFWDQLSPSIFDIFTCSIKVKHILKCSLDSILSPIGSPTPSVEILVGKFAWGVKAKHCQQTFENKKFVDITQQCFALLHQVNFPTNNLNFHWRWGVWKQATFKNLLYFNIQHSYSGELNGHLKCA